MILRIEFLSNRLSLRPSIRVVHRGREPQQPPTSSAIFGGDSYRYLPRYSVYACGGGSPSTRCPL